MKTKKLQVKISILFIFNCRTIYKLFSIHFDQNNERNLISLEIVLKIMQKNKIN